MTTRSLAVAAILLALCGRSAAEEPHAAHLRTTARSDWYAIHLAGSKVGWAERSSGPARRNGVDVLRIAFRVQMRMKTGDAVRETRIEREKLYAARAPHAFLSASSVVTRGRRGKRTEVRRAAGGKRELVARITSAGETRLLPVSVRPPTYDEEMAPFAWMRAARKPGDRLRHRSFDLGELTSRVVALEVKRVWRAPDGRRRVESAQTTGETTDRVRHDGEGRLLWTKMMGLLELRHTTREAALRPVVASDVLGERRATVNRKLGPRELVEGLVLRARGPGVARLRSGPRQSVRFDPATGVLTLWLGTAAGRPVPARAADVQAALTETPAHPLRHRLVRSLASEVTAKATSRRARVAALVAFVKRFVIDTRDTEPLTVVEILARQEGDCSEHALLFTTLARAAGIPAREVSGFAYRGDGEPSFGWHAWCEVVLNGIWVPVDPMWGEIPADATHIREGPKGTGAQLALAGATLEVAGIRTRPPPKEIPDPPDWE